MERSELKQRKVVNKKNDLLTKLQKKIKKKVKRNVKRNEKRNEGLDGTRQCRKIGVPERRRPRIKGAPGHEGMFLKGLRTKYISRETLNEANEARKNEDINKIIDIGRAFQKKGQESGGRKSTAETTARPVFNTDATIILQENNVQPEDPNTTVKKEKLNLDKELIMFSLLYEEKVGSQLLPRLTQYDILEEAFKALRNIPENDTFLRDETLENEFVKEFKFFTENLEREIPLAKIFREDFHNRNHAQVTEKQSSDICIGFTERPIEDDSINLSGMGICENDPVFTTSFGEEQLELQTKESEKQRIKLNTSTPQIQFYRRNMF